MFLRTVKRYTSAKHKNYKLNYKTRCNVRVLKNRCRFYSNSVSTSVKDTSKLLTAVSELEQTII